MDINLIEKIIKELQEQKTNNIESCKESLVTDLYKIKNDAIELQNKNEELNNRFGLFWKEIPEKMIKTISNNEIVYGKSLYCFITKIENGEGKKIDANINGFETILTRQADSYLFKDSQKNEYLVYSNSLYKFLKETEEEYIPTLKNKGDNFFIGNSENNILIEGDNYYALQMLQYTHKGKIDIIYIDPPYNTGNKDFKYNDKFVKNGDSDKHSSWLSFMEKRLLLSKKLLSKNGIIALSIDDKELFNLKLLMDKIYGEENFVNNITVKMSELAGVKMSHVSNGNKFPKVKETLLLYCFDKKELDIQIPKTLKEKWDNEYRSFVDGLSKEDREYLKTLEGRSVSEKELFKADSILQNTKVLNETTAMKKYGNGIDKQTFRNENAWRYVRTIASSTIKKLALAKVEHVDAELFSVKTKRDSKFYICLSSFNRESNSPRVALYFADSNLEKYVDDIWIDIKTTGLNNEMPEGVPVFKNGQKPLDLIKRILSSKNDKNAIILDFFAGSGTTGQAVWDLNKEDKGNRKFILVTNNENNICEGTTFQRLRKTNEKYNYGESLKYLTINHISEKILRKEDNRGQFETLKEIVNLKYNSFKIVEENDKWYANENIAILKDFDYIDEFKEKFLTYEYLGFVTNEETEWNIFKEKLSSTIKENNLTQFSSSYMNEIRKFIKGRS